jgi:acetate kinase
MKILVINCGSFTLKFELFEITQMSSSPEFDRVAVGLSIGWPEAISSKKPRDAWQETLR